PQAPAGLFLASGAGRAGVVVWVRLTVPVTDGLKRRPGCLLSAGLEIADRATFGLRCRPAANSPARQLPARPALEAEESPAGA
ncbi:hypothetical protein, partial [Streptomyces koyangensis]|uniref:hypothetical protein n=1 Tax=Streptomyces koyangensis TaxID=188770 RepID=UPI003BF4D37A